MASIILLKIFMKKIILLKYFFCNLINHNKIRENLRLFLKLKEIASQKTGLIKFRKGKCRLGAYIIELITITFMKILMIK